tara:strand:- start:474 stop:608 length:135 start_codon:yes stop_codon:yes gene_type:complete
MANCQSRKHTHLDSSPICLVPVEGIFAAPDQTLIVKVEAGASMM